MAKIRFDEYELKMLQILQEAGRTPVSELAELIGLSTTPCGRRFEGLQKSGAIRGLTTHSGDAPERFKTEILKRPEVTACWALTGDQDFLLNVLVPDVDALNEFVMQKLMKIEVVRDVKTNLVLENVKPDGALPLDHRISTR